MKINLLSSKKFQLWIQTDNLPIFENSNNIFNRVFLCGFPESGFRNKKRSEVKYEYIVCTKLGWLLFGINHKGCICKNKYCNSNAN